METCTHSHTRKFYLTSLFFSHYSGFGTRITKIN